jgi:RNA polymerase sigma factor (sigma-70 family)
MAVAVGTASMSDAELIAASREGNADAYAELYRRHRDSALAGARALTRSRSDADDVVSDAFAKVLRVLQNGGGPELAFRPYLLTAVRNSFYDKVRRTREQPTDDVQLEGAAEPVTPADTQDDTSFAAAAFATLPERWQQVLWYTEVEGKSAAQVAPILGLAPNAVAALAYRAREGLRQAYLQAHLRHQPSLACNECSSSLGAYVRDGLSARDRRKVDEHLHECESCSALLAELVDTNSTLRAALIPAVLGVPAAAYLSGLGGVAGKGVIGWLLRGVRSNPATAAAGAAVAAAVVAVGVVAATGGEPPPAAAPTTVTVTVAATQPDTEPDTTAVDTTVRRTTAPADTTAPAPDTTPSTTPPVVLAPPPATPPRTTPVTRPRPAPPQTTRPTTTAPPATQPAPTTAAPTTVPPNTAAPTTVPPTTVPPLTLTASVAQRGPAFPGGQLQLVATLANSNGRRPAASVLDLRLPAGLSVVSTDNADWSCTAAGVCTVAGTGDSIAAINIAVASSVTAVVTVQPVMSVPVASISGALTVTPVTVAGFLHQSIGRGEVIAVGNSVLTCRDNSPSCADARQGIGTRLDNDDYQMQHVTVPGVGAFNSSSASLDFTGSVTAAYLVWGGDLAASGIGAPDDALRNTVSLAGPGGVSTPVVSTQVVDLPGGVYTAAADVTALVSAPGVYSVGDVQTAVGRGSFGGWSLVVVTNDPSQPVRLRVVAAPGFQVGDSPYTAAVALPSAAAGQQFAAAVVSFNSDLGDRGESFAVSGTPLPATFDSIITGARQPADVNNFGVDVLTAAVPISGSSVDARIATTDDRFVIAAFGFTLDLP